MLFHPNYTLSTDGERPHGGGLPKGDSKVSDVANLKAQAVKAKIENEALDMDFAVLASALWHHVMILPDHISPTSTNITRTDTGHEQHCAI